MIYLFADIADSVFQGQEQTQAWVENSLTDLWTKLIVEGLFYQNIAVIAAYITVFFIGLWALDFFNKWQEYGERPSSYNTLFKGILIIILLGRIGGAPPLSGQLIYQLHNVVNGSIALLNNGLQATLDDVKQANLVSQAWAKSKAQAIATTAIRNCAAVSNIDDRNACFNTASGQINDLLAPYSSYQWARALVQKLNAEIAQVQGSGYSNSQFLPRLFRGLSPLISNSITQTGIAMFLLTFGAGINFGVHLCELITALLAPFALALSIGDLENIAPLKRWISSFLALGTIKLVYGILVALTAYVSIRSGTDSDMLLYPLIFGAIAPFISIGAGYFGGVTVFASLTRLSRGFVSGIL